eukprot:scaffold40578_cov72-Cyclotella_meneghiniana.AAC.3
MKVSTLALALVLSFDGSAAFQPSHSFHQSSRLHLSPFAQVAQLFNPTNTVNGSKEPAHVVDEPVGGPGCIRKVNLEESNGKITYRNQVHLHESLGLNEASGGPGCIRKADFDSDKVKITYRNQAHLHESFRLNEASGGPGCIRKADFDSEQMKITYRNQAHLHESLVLLNEASGGPGCIKKAGFDDEKVKITYRNQNHLHKALEVEPKSPIRASEELTPVSIKTAPETRPQKTVSAPTSTEEELDYVDKEQKVYGVVNTKKLNKLYDLVVIGGGPAGVAGAIKAAQMGRRAILIDKALRDSAKNTNVSAMKAQEMDSDVIWKQITNSVVKLAMRNAEGQCRTLARYGIDYLQGSAQLLSEDDKRNVAALQKFSEDIDNPSEGIRTVRVSNTAVIDDFVGYLDNANVHITGTKILVATGSKSTRLPGIPFDQNHRIFDSDTINLLGYLPRSVTISGLGIIGIEFANIFSALGVEDVKILVRGDIASSTKKLGMDMDVANELMRLLKESGVQILEATTVEEFLYVPPPENNDELIQMKLNDGSILETDLFFAATGRYPMGKCTETGLGKAGLEVADRGMVSIDKKSLKTSSNNVYAAGDCIGPPALAS